MMPLTYSIPTAVFSILDRLEKAGFEAYIVGGWVRDRILNIPDQDCDITTSAHPHQIQDVFKDYSQSEIGKDHGTIGIKVDQEWIEITTYRIDQEIHDHRHPKSVQFTHDLKEDVIRRDFTINALAMDKDGKLHDYVGGLSDLEERVIRCVGDPHLRFEEDALRILRGLRLSSKLNFTFEEKTLLAMHTHKALIHTLAVERIWHEFEAWMKSPVVSMTLQSSLDIVYEFIPEIKHVSLDWINTFDHQPFMLRMMAIFFGSTAEDITYRCRTLKTSLDIQSHILKRLSALESTLQSDYDLKKAIGRYSYEVMDDCFQFNRVFRPDQYESNYEEKMHVYQSENVCVSLGQLAVKGHDVMALGYQNEAIRQALEFLLDSVMKELVPNKKQALLRFLRESKT